MAESKSEQTKWAREVLNAYFDGREPEVTLESDDLEKKGACFVTLHKPDGSLRGCIGTILPVRGSLKDETKENAVSAAIRDPRFDPLTKEELEDLDISVDVLGSPELINAIEQLDHKLYGVIVSDGARRGVLLPDLDGVESVDQQLQIAMQKAGIPPGTPIAVERFKVSRYH